MIGWATAGMAAGVIGAHAQAKAMRMAIDEQRRQFDLLRNDAGRLGWGQRKRDASLSEMAREHKARMAAEHAETMRQARIGTWLLVALALAIGWNVARLLGVWG